MSHKKSTQREFGTCFENMPFAEQMRKMMGEQGIGSLCAEMMKKVMEKKGDCQGFDCAEMMRTIMTEGRKD